MSIHITRRLGTALTVAAAGLFMQIGGVVAASRPVDFQQQVRKVLSGGIAAHALPDSGADRAKTVGSNSDAQRFAQRLLLGWSAAHVGHTPAPKQNLQAEELDGGLKPLADEDFQVTVRRSLLGESVSSRGAL